MGAWESSVRLPYNLLRTCRPQRSPYTRDSVAEAIGAVTAAFELVDDRHADYTKIADHILTLLADNTWNGGIVLGSPLTDWQSLDLAAIHGTMRINDEIVGEGDGRDVMGHPLDALAWLASTLATQGKSLAQGMVVMTGSVVATKFVSRGDRVQLTMDGAGRSGAERCVNGATHPGPLGHPSKEGIGKTPLLGGVPRSGGVGSALRHHTVFASYVPGGDQEYPGLLPHLFV